MSQLRLLLFDIDGTLIYSNRMGMLSLAGALEQTFGTAGPIDQYQLGGKTDRQMILDLMMAAGFSPTEVEAKMELVFKYMTVKGHQLFQAGNGLRPCPGVPALLAHLHNHPQSVLGLLTGNICSTSPLKLRGAGIDPTQFRVGAYGSDSADRNDLPLIAMQRASQLLQQEFNFKNSIIIGDTPADIICARCANVPAVAVATGKFTAATLAQYRPDYLLENLTDTTAVLNILLPERMNYE